VSENQVSLQPKTPGANLKQWVFLFGIATLSILADQASKAYVVHHLPYQDSWVPIGFIEPLFKFTHVHNTGASFGMFPQGGSVFLVIALIVSLIIIYYYRQIPPQAWLTRLALGLQLGGALGNAVDRLRLGYVVDFFHVEHFPVFNVADSSIVIGVCLLALEMLLEEWRAARQEKQQPASEKSV
jgi:signal peptidase II